MSSRRDRRWRALALAAAAALGACKSPSPPARSSDDAGPGSARAAPPIVKQLAPPAAVVMDAPKLELPKQESFRLLDAGQGPRAPLRYQLAAGTVELVMRTALTSRRLEGTRSSSPVTLPAIRDGFAVTVTPEAPDRLALRALVAEPERPSADADAYLARWRTLLQNRRITAQLDDRGGFSRPRFGDDPTGARSELARDELVQRLLATIVPLPAEPVAPGARWRVVTILRQGPAYAKQTAIYTLVSREPARWKLHVKLQRVAEEQRLSDPSLPAGTTADLLAMFRVLEGDVEVDPALPMIAGGSLAVESRMHVRLTPAGQRAVEQIFEDTGTVSFSHEP